MTFRIGGKGKSVVAPASVLSEGADGDGESVRQHYDIPDDEAKRRKFFSNEDKRKEFMFEKGRCYQFDFHNGYIDWKNYALKLPGFSLNVLKWINDRTHTVRFALKNRKTGAQYLIVTFSLLFGDELKKATTKSAGVSRGEQDQTEGVADVSSHSEQQREVESASEDGRDGQHQTRNTVNGGDTVSGAAEARTDHELPGQDRSGQDSTNNFIGPKPVQKSQSEQDHTPNGTAEGHRASQQVPGVRHHEHESAPRSHNSDHEETAHHSIHEPDSRSNAITHEPNNHTQPPPHLPRHESNDQNATPSQQPDYCTPENLSQQNITMQQPSPTTTEQAIPTTQLQNLNLSTQPSESSNASQPSTDEYKHSIEESLCQTASVDGRGKVTSVLR